MDMYLGKKQSSEFNLGLVEEVVLQLTKLLEKPICTVYFDNFFNDPTLMKKLFENNIYAIGTVRSNRKQMEKMTDGKKMKQGDSKFLLSNKVMVCKWMDNWSVLLLSTALEGLNDFLSVRQRKKAPNRNLPSRVQRLSNCTTTGWEVSTSWIKEKYHIDWIVSLLFVLTFGYSSIR